jgi:hypothetical protein
VVCNGYDHERDVLTAAGAVTVVAPRVDDKRVDPDWIGPVVDAVDTYLPVFHDAFDDETAWGYAKHVAAALTERGVDLTDRHGVDNAIQQLNAEQLAHRLLP